MQWKIQKKKKKKKKHEVCKREREASAHGTTVRPKKSETYSLLGMDCPCGGGTLTVVNPPSMPNGRSSSLWVSLSSPSCASSTRARFVLPRPRPRAALPDGFREEDP